MNHHLLDTRRRYAALPACLFLALAVQSTVAAERPLNVVFFLVGDLGYMDVGANNPIRSTKHRMSTGWGAAECGSPMVTQPIRFVVPRAIAS